APRAAGAHQHDARAGGDRHLELVRAAPSRDRSGGPGGLARGRAAAHGRRYAPRRDGPDRESAADQSGGGARRITPRHRDNRDRGPDPPSGRLGSRAYRAGGSAGPARADAPGGARAADGAVRGGTVRPAAGHVRRRDAPPDEPKRAERTAVPVRRSTGTAGSRSVRPLRSIARSGGPFPLVHLSLKAMPSFPLRSAAVLLS